MSGKILVIAEQQRLQRLLAGVDEAQGRGVIVVAGLVDAADQIEQEVPELILVQDRLSGFSAELIVRHLRSRLKDAPAMIVLASEAADVLDLNAADLHLLDSSQPDQELVRQLERLVARLPKRQPEPVPEPVPAATDEFVPLRPALPVAPEQPVATPEVAEEPATEPEETTVAGPEPGEVLQPTTGSVDSAEVPRVASRFDAELETELARLEPAVGGKPAPDVEPALSVDELLTVTATVAGRPPVGARRWLGAAVIAMLLITASWFGIRSQSSAPPPAATKPGAAVIPAPAERAVTLPHTSAAKLPAATSSAGAAVALPRFITQARAVPDPAYGHDHAGWERYLTPTLEFKLFREGGRLKALQVLDRAGEGLPTRLFTAAMEELTQVRDYRTEGRELKGDYLVKKGRLAEGSKIIIYKDRQDVVLHGFVIYFN